MNGHAHPHANVPATCRHGEPGCVGPDGPEPSGEHYHYVCPACMADAAAAEHGSGRCTAVVADD